MIYHQRGGGQVLWMIYDPLKHFGLKRLYSPLHEWYVLFTIVTLKALSDQG